MVMVARGGSLMINKWLRTGGMILLMALLMAVGIGGMSVQAAEEQKTTTVFGKIYDCDPDRNYVYSDPLSIMFTGASSPAFGTLSLEGKVVKEGKQGNYVSYGVDGETAALSYSCNGKYITAMQEQWHLFSDDGKIIGDLELNEKIQLGSIVLQSSKDGVNWRKDVELTNVFEKGTGQPGKFSTMRDIQLNNGTYYRVIVAYKTEIKRGESQVLFVKYSNLEYRKTVELYEFYVYNVNSVEKKNRDVIKKNLGTVVNTGLNNGFALEDAIKLDDPHYGWSLGDFFVCGYTRETKDDKGDPVFLKNVGDEVVLYFNLAQNIDALNGDDTLIIMTDRDGYDQYFQTAKGYGGRGTLIVRYTDHEGVKHTPQIYTDYLEANASSGADTIVKLFEEGDYEVALDYELRRIGKVFSVEINVPNPVFTWNYRIFFRFSVRNGNCMVYPFDVKTGAELGDTSWTKNGFRLDMARSRYLTIDVKRTVVKKSGNTYTEDVRFNRPAKDGDAYTEEGIYTFSVNNLYTGESTVKNIYVGESAVIQALAKNKLTVEELNSLLKEGTTMNEDGSLAKPAS